jgi:hypothetical protein
MFIQRVPSVWRGTSTCGRTILAGKLTTTI